VLVPEFVNVEVLRALRAAKLALLQVGKPPEQPATPGKLALHQNFPACSFLFFIAPGVQRRVHVSFAAEVHFVRLGKEWLSAVIGQTGAQEISFRRLQAFSGFSHGVQMKRRLQVLAYSLLDHQPQGIEFFGLLLVIGLLPWMNSDRVAFVNFLSVVEDVFELTLPVFPEVSYAPDVPGQTELLQQNLNRKTAQTVIASTVFYECPVSPHRIE